jgi:hypothetical protein
MISMISRYSLLVRLFIVFNCVRRLDGQIMSKLISKVYDGLYHHSVSNLLSKHHIHQISEETFVDMYQAAELSHDIYGDTIYGGEVMTRDRNYKPECVMKLIKNELWIVVRGTQTPTDMFRDVTWAISSKLTDDITVPTSVLLQANEMTENIQNLLVSDQKYKKIEKIYITGHSLGGSIATAVYFNLIYKLKLTLPMKVFTFGAPFLVSCTTNKEVINLEKNVYNIIYQMDIIPRLMGADRMPDYLFLSKVYDIKFLNSRKYSAFGQYISATRRGKIGFIDNIAKFMSEFPSNEIDFMYSIVNDHSMGTILTSLRKISRGAKKSRML